MPAPSLEHDLAEQRLEAALAAQHQLSERYAAATGESAALVADAALRAADQEVRARDAWLRWVDDEHYHGLNAGPFELRREGDKAVSQLQLEEVDVAIRRPPDLRGAVEAALAARDGSDRYDRSQRKTLSGRLAGADRSPHPGFDSTFPTTHAFSGLARRVGQLMRDARTP
jgi:multidrug efflux pump subunit AcrA (membrane-fusion protein)